MEKTRVIVSDVYLLDLGSKKETRVFNETVIGRAECDMNFPDDSLISRRHVRLVPSDETVMIEDLGSTNNTLVNGKLLKPKTLYKLRSRDVIQFGKQKFQIFIGGKLAEDPTSTKPLAEGQKTSAFSRLVATKDEVREAKKAGGRELGGLEDFAAMDTIPTFGENELAIQKALAASASWYLQFDGSEFGPLSLGEMRAIVNSENFQGGDLFVWAEELPSWILIDRKHKLFQVKKDEAAPSQDFSLPVALVAMVYWQKTDGTGKKKVTGTCNNISLTEISVSTSDELSEPKPFEIDVAPRGGTGVERFRMMVSLDRDRSRKPSYVLNILSLPPKTKQLLARYMKEQSGS